MLNDRLSIQGSDGNAVEVADGMMTIYSGGASECTTDLAGVFSVIIAGSDEEAGWQVLINFRNPDHVIDGQRASYLPFVIEMDPAGNEQTLAFVIEVRRMLAEQQRHRLSDFPDVPWMAFGTDGLDGPTSIRLAADRMVGKKAGSKAHAALERVLRPGEKVREMMSCSLRRTKGILAVTTRRALFVDGKTVSERPLAGMRWAMPSEDGTVLTVQDALQDTMFEKAEHYDVERVAASMQVMLGRAGHVGARSAVFPTTMQLFDQWVQLTDRVALGMLPEEQASRELRGIYYAAMF